MVRKGVSLEEKRNRLMKIYHDEKAVFNLKEIEKKGAKAGVVMQTIKDVNQALCDDGLVDFDKIGSGNYFWSFPSKQLTLLKNKLNAATKKRDELVKDVEKKQEALDSAKAERVESDDRTKKLEQFKELTATVSELKRKVSHLRENDPAVLEEIAKKTKVVAAGAERWTDNVFTIKKWIQDKNGCSNAEVQKWLGISDDFDYV